MNLQKGAGRGADGALVVGQAGDVGRADFAKDGPADTHDVGNAKAAADLDELAPRDDDLLALTERAQGDDRGGCIVVDRRGRLRPGQAANPLADSDLAGRAFARFEVEFQVEVTPGGFQGGAG